MRGAPLAEGCPAPAELCVASTQGEGTTQQKDESVSKHARYLVDDGWRSF